MNYQQPVMELFDAVKLGHTNEYAIESVVFYFNDLNRRGKIPNFPGEEELRKTLTWYSEQEWLQQSSNTLRRLNFQYDQKITLELDSDMEGLIYVSDDRSTIYLHEEKFKALTPTEIEAVLTHEFFHQRFSQQV